MEIQENRQKATSMQRRSEICNIEVPREYSRIKAIQFAKKNNSNAIPETEARQVIYMMLVKIGATSELPQDKQLRVSFINDFWRVMYFKNNYCPGDIPFGIIMDSFTTAMVQGIVERKGNNQAAITQAFNKWVTRDDTRAKLYQKRDEMYPKKKPKRLEKNASPETISDYSDEELMEKFNNIQPMKGLKLVDIMLDELKKEIKKRGLTVTKK